MKVWEFWTGCELEFGAELAKGSGIMLAMVLLGWASWRGCILVWKMCFGMVFVSVGCRQEHESYSDDDDARIESWCWGWAPLPPLHADGMTHR